MDELIFFHLMSEYQRMLLDYFTVFNKVQKVVVRIFTIYIT